MKILYVNVAAGVAEEPNWFTDARHQFIALTDFRHEPDAAAVCDCRAGRLVINHSSRQHSHA